MYTFPLCPKQPASSRWFFGGGVAPVGEFLRSASVMASVRPVGALVDRCRTFNTFVLLVCCDVELLRCLSFPQVVDKLCVSRV